MPRRRQTNKKPSTTVERRSQLDHLVVMRESAKYDRILMDGMIRQTLAKVPHLPGAAELAEVGVEIFADPERYGGVARRSGDSRMVSVERDGVLFHYSMGTAAKKDLPDSNAFVQELVQLVETYRPREVWAVAFTRLLRSAELAGELLQTFSANIDVLHCEADINLTTPEGKMLFQVLAMIAATERDYIVRRHTAGRVAQWRRGEWIPNAYPPGYRVDDKKIELDTDSIEDIRRMLSILADSSLTASQCAKQIGEVGVTTPAVARIHGAGATVADARNPSEVVRTLVGWVDSYETGVYEMLWPNPFPGVSDVAGLDVEHDETEIYPNGLLRLTQTLPMPDGDWADQATFEAIRRRETVPSTTGGASHNVAPPLSGMFKFSDAGLEYAVSAGDGTYRLLRRPVDPHRRFPGWTSESDASADRTDVEHVASVNRAAWHQSIADAVTEAVRDGLPAALDSTRFQPIGGLPPLNERRARARRLRRELSDTEANLRRARRNVSLTDDDEIAISFMAQVEQHTRQAKQIETELAELEADGDPAELTETFESNAELVAQAIAALSNATNSADAAVASALRTVISDERWTLTGTTLHWELTIELPHQDGTVILGPITGEVLCTPAQPQALRRTKAARRAVRDELTAAGLSDAAARSAAACTHNDLSATLLAHLTSQPLPEHVDRQWARHVIAVYTDADFSWNKDRWRLDDDIRRQALQLVRDAGGDLRGADAQDSPLAQHQYRYLSRVDKTPSGDPILVREGRAPNHSYRLIVCPHCDHHADHSIVSPETKPGVLCSHCWRTPDPGSPVFPEWYRTDLVGPRTDPAPEGVQGG